MHKPNYILLSFSVLLAILIGILGGGVMGSVAGYYTAQMIMPIEAAIPTAGPASPKTPLLQAAPPPTTNLVLKEDSAVVDAVRKTRPAVVTVINDLAGRGGLFGTGGGTASGSGIIIDSKGYIVTNDHVIDGERSLSVIYADGTQANANLVGADPIADIAVIKVDGQVPAVATFGDSNALEPGQVAIAIGSPLGEFRGTVTIGIVSALNRTVGRQEGLIQTDAAINNGNSGGPLLNSLGQVIGINTLVVRSTDNGDIAEGLGFAIPSNLARDIADQLIAGGKVEHPYVGVTFQPLDQSTANSLGIDTTQGVMVTQVMADSPAAQAGLKEQDVILGLDADKIDQNHSLLSLLSKHNAGDTVTLSVVRDGKHMDVKLVLAAHP
ncbi:MAG: trypsin-like peptidase domain-containing protein [Chloroflexi bacterium]|nr:trypsin-like peptidase domain-containing protein [Chloroflexota bacterium]